MDFSTATVLVTGATGFLGSVLTRRLVQEGARVQALTRSPHRAAGLQNLPNVRVVRGDVTDPASLGEAMAGVTLVFHAAVNYTDAAAQRAVNVDGTRHVARAAADAGAQRLIHASSVVVYGYETVGDIFESSPLVRSAIDPYNQTKLDAEQAVREVATARGLSYSIIRPSPIYGAGSEMWTKRLFKLARLRPMPFPGYGVGSAHPIYVDDVADMMLTMAAHPAADGEAFNCAPDPAVTWRAWMSEYMRLAGNRWWLAVPPSLLLGVVPLLCRVAPEGAIPKDASALLSRLSRRYRFRMDKARTLLSWQPSTSLRAGVEQCAPWLREQGLLR